LDNKGKHRVLVISDTQEPFGHRDAIPFLKWAKQKYAPDMVVHVGDEVDFHALGDWDHDPDGYSPGHELSAALERMELYYDLFPNVLACRSNHTDRPLRRAFKAGIPSAFLRDYKEFLNAPRGWSWADVHKIDGIVYEHGEGFSGHMAALNCAMKHGDPTVIGHVHSHAGILYSANEKRILYGMNVGCLIDRHRYAFRYGRNLKHKPILGIGIVDKGIPTFVPMLLNADHRWVKQ
jgi:hypothetical protein